MLALKNALPSSNTTRAQRCRPAQKPTLPCAARNVGGQACAHRGFHQAEHRLAALCAVFSGESHRHLAVDVGETAAQPLDQVEWKVRRIARHGGQIARFAMREPGKHAGKGPGIVRNLIGPDRYAHRCIHVEIAVGVDHHHANLRREAPQRMQRQRHPKVVLQSLVHTAHAAAAASGENEAGDIADLNVHGPGTSPFYTCAPE